MKIMKKLFLLFFGVCMVASVNAQLYVGGSLSAWTNKMETTEKSTIKFMPEMGFFVSDWWSFGTLLGYTIQDNGSSGSNSTTSTVEFAPYARLSFFYTGPVRLFVEGGFSLYSSKTGDADRKNTLSAGLKPGIALDLSDRISLVAKLGFFGYRQYSEDDVTYEFTLGGNGLSFGAYYTF